MSAKVLAQGKSDVNGPHQGAWVHTAFGEDWFLHFQDKGCYGRVVHLQPVEWRDNWPVMGIDKDGDYCGDPVKTYRKPKHLKLGLFKILLKAMSLISLSWVNNGSGMQIIISSLVCLLHLVLLESTIIS